MYSSSWLNWPSESPRRPRTPSTYPTSSDSSAFSSPTPSFSLGEDGQFSLRELKVATDNFSDNNIINRRNFGDTNFGDTYKGKLADGSLVAVKRAKDYITYTKYNSEQFLEEQFQSEIRMTNFPAHKNLLRLCGFCKTTTEKLLVYPYAVNGSLASCLRERVPTKPPLDWPTRRRIALGSARGLSYLHDHCDPYKIIHRNVKAANILLDEEYEPVVGDFGLARLMDYEDTHVTTTVRGTYRHIAPEYLSRGECSEKTDVFGYGIMLLELITGQKVKGLLKKNQVKGLLKKKRLEMLVDPNLKTNYIESEMESLIQVALLCTQGFPMDRPKMSEVVRMLESEDYTEIAEKWEQCEKSLRATYDYYYDFDQNLTSIELSSPR